MLQSNEQKILLKKILKKKELLLEFLVKQELYRNKLCYGKAKDTEIVEEAVKNLFEFKNIIEQLLGETL